jgi:putative endonuclease
VATEENALSSRLVFFSQYGIRQEGFQRIVSMGTALYFIYVLECADRTFYTGYTNNVEKRVNDHNNGRAGARYTRGRRPVKVVYVEAVATLSIALQREAEIKKLSRAQKMLLLKGYSDSITVAS